MHLALVRHGQTDWNRTGRLQGTSDVALNDIGLEQAAQAAGRLAEDHWDTIIASPLRRAAATADIIAARLELPRQPADPALVERSYGQAEGLTPAAATERFGPTWPGMEGYAELERRGRDAIDALGERLSGLDVIVVTHGTFIRAFVDAITGLATVKPGNGESVHIAGCPGAWHVTAGLRR